MRKTLAQLLVAGSLLNGCGALGPNDKFVYPDVVRSLEYRNRYFSLESVVRQKGRLYAGASAVEITPYDSQYLAGFGANRKSEGVLDELFARTVVIAYDDKTVALVSLDLVGLANENVQDIRRLVSRIKGNFVDEVIICSTHSHSAPDTIGLWGPGLPFLPVKSGVDKRYVAFLYDKIVESVYRAAKDVREAGLRSGYKVVSADRRISLNKKIPELIDRELNVLQFVEKDGRVVATVVNYACHPEVLRSHNKLISSDFVGELNYSLERRYGGVSLFFNQSAGAVTAVVDGAKKRTLEGAVEEMRRIGKTLADEVSDCLKSADGEKVSVIGFYRSEFFVPVENDWFLFANDIGLLRKREYDGKVKTEMARIDLGGVQILTVPGETFPNVGFELKRRMKGKKLLLGLANDELGYLMRNGEARSRFEYERSMSPGPSAGETIIQKGAELLERK